MANFYGITESLMQALPYYFMRNGQRQNPLAEQLGQATQPPPGAAIAFEPQAVAGMEELPVQGQATMGIPAPQIQPQFQTAAVAPSILPIEPSAIATRPMPSAAISEPLVDFGRVLQQPEPIAYKPAPVAEVAQPLVSRRRVEEPPVQEPPVGAQPMFYANPMLSMMALGLGAVEPQQLLAAAKPDGELKKGGGAKFVVKQYDPETDKTLDVQTDFIPATADKPAQVTYVNPMTGYPSTITADTQDPWEQDFFKRAEQAYTSISQEKSPTRTLADTTQKQALIRDAEGRERYYPYIPGDTPGTIKIKTGAMGSSIIPVTEVIGYDKDPELLSIYEAGRSASPFNMLAQRTGQRGSTYTVETQPGQPQQLPSLRSIATGDAVGQKFVGEYIDSIKTVVGTDPDTNLPTIGYEFDPEQVPQDVQERLTNRANEINQVIKNEYNSIIASQEPKESSISERTVEIIDSQIRALQQEQAKLNSALSNPLSPADAKAMNEQLTTVNEALADKQAERIRALTQTVGVTKTAIGGGASAITNTVTPGLSRISNVIPDWSTIMGNIMLAPAEGMEPQQSMAVLGQLKTPEQFGEALKRSELAEINLQQKSKLYVDPSWSPFFDYVDDVTNQVRTMAEEQFGIGSEQVLDMPINNNDRVTLRTVYEDMDKLSASYQKSVEDGTVDDKEVFDINTQANKIFNTFRNGIRIRGEGKTPKGEQQKFNEYFEGPAKEQLPSFDRRTDQAVFARKVEQPASNLPAFELRVKRATEFRPGEAPNTAINRPPASTGTPKTRYIYRPGFGRMNGAMAPVSGSTLQAALSNITADPAERGKILAEALYSPNGWTMAVGQSMATHGRSAVEAQADQVAKDSIDKLNKWLFDKNDSGSKESRREYSKGLFSTMDSEGMGWFEANSPYTADDFANDSEALLQGSFPGGASGFRRKYGISEQGTLVGNTVNPRLRQWGQSQYAKDLKATGEKILRWNPSGTVAGWPKNLNISQSLASVYSIGSQINQSLYDWSEMMARGGGSIPASGAITTRTGAGVKPVTWLTYPGQDARPAISVPSSWQQSSSGVVVLSGATNPTGIDSQIVSTTDITAARPIYRKVIDSNVFNPFIDSVKRNAPASIKAEFGRIQSGMQSNISNRTMTIGASEDENVYADPANTPVAGLESFLIMTIPMMMLQYNDGASIQSRTIK